VVVHDAGVEVQVDGLLELPGGVDVACGVDVDVEAVALGAIAGGQTTSDSQYALEFGDGCIEGPPADTYTDCDPGVTGC